MFTEIFKLVIETISSLYLMIILARFILQLSRADFYNPISQFVVKATNPLVIPLRKFIPGFGGFDVASLVLAILFKMAVLALTIAVLAQTLPNLIGLVLTSVVMVIGVLLKIYFWVLLIMIIASWIAPGSAHPALLLVNQISEPLMKPFRNLLPPMGGLDLSPILVFLALQVLQVMAGHFERQVALGFPL